MPQNKTFTFSLKIAVVNILCHGKPEHILKLTQLHVLIMYFVVAIEARLALLFNLLQSSQCWFDQLADILLIIIEVLRIWHHSGQLGKGLQQTTQVRGALFELIQIQIE